MVPNRNLHCVIRFDVAKMELERKRKKARKLAYYKRMKAAGIRGTSIQKYLRRGFPGAFVRALLSEMEGLADDMRRRWWLG